MNNEEDEMRIKLFCILVCICVMLTGCGSFVKQRYDDPASAFMAGVDSSIEIVEEKAVIEIDGEKILWIAVTKDFNGYGVSASVMDVYKGRYALTDRFSYVGDRTTFEALDSSAFSTDGWNHVTAYNSEKNFMWQFVSADSLGCKREDAFNYKSFETEIMGEMHNYVLIYYVV